MTSPVIPQNSCAGCKHRTRQPHIRKLRRLPSSPTGADPAFVQGRLDRDEFGLRADRALASRTYADLATLTADIPAWLARASPLTRATSRADPDAARERLEPPAEA